MGSGEHTQSPGVRSLPELCGNDVYGDKKNSVFGDKGSGEPEKQHRKAESAVISAWEEMWARSDSCFLPQLPALAPIATLHRATATTGTE